jgi:hypothetical protein
LNQLLPDITVLSSHRATTLKSPAHKIHTLS